MKLESVNHAQLAVSRSKPYYYFLFKLLYLFVEINFYRAEFCLRLVDGWILPVGRKAVISKSKRKYKREREKKRREKITN